MTKHIDREHSTKDPDENFVLHENCQRCAALYQSHMENKTSQEIPFRDMVFKCPHCCTVLYANHKHAPRYLYNHIHKFHTDPDINDFTLGGQEASDFRLRSKNESDVLTCEFCAFVSYGENFLEMLKKEHFFEFIYTVLFLYRHQKLEQTTTYICLLVNRAL